MFTLSGRGARHGGGFSAVVTIVRRAGASFRTLNRCAQGYKLCHRKGLTL